MFDWRDYLALAHNLASGTEAEQRSAISRAYYAAHHVARVYVIRDMHYSPRGHGVDHQGVIDELQGHGATRLQVACAVKLAALRQLRSWADYDSRLAKNLPRDVARALQDAAAIIRDLA